MKRRDFLQNVSLTMAGVPFLPGILRADKQQWYPNKKIISISYNVYEFKGYPETDDTKPVLAARKSQMPERMALELAIYNPDIITFQEAPAEAEVRKVANLLSMKYVFFPGGFPGAILTKFDIVSYQNCPLASMKSPGDLFSRHWGKATLKSDTDVIKLYSAHLHPSNEEIRRKEVAEVLQVMEKDSIGNQYVIFQGDLNHEPIQNEYDSWKDAGLSDCYMKKGVEQRDTIKSTFPNRAVDYIWVNELLAKRLLRCKVLYEGNFRTNPMDERSVALSDHLPVMAEFS